MAAPKEYILDSDFFNPALVLIEVAKENGLRLDLVEVKEGRVKAVPARRTDQRYLQTLFEDVRFQAANDAFWGIDNKNLFCEAWPQSPEILKALRGWVYENRARGKNLSEPDYALRTRMALEAEMIRKHYVGDQAAMPRPFLRFLMECVIDQYPSEMFYKRAKPHNKTLYGV